MKIGIRKGVKLEFEDFVIPPTDKEGKYLIRNMADKGALSQLDIANIKKIRDMDYDELYVLLKNVKECTELRSKRKQSVICL